MDTGYNTLLFCTGISGSGKSYFIKNILPQIAPQHDFYNLKSATTREMRDGEKDGREYYFRDEKYFETTDFATKLWVNEAFWKPGMKKWMYGVPSFEIINNLGRNLVYDVIQPKYIREMIDWFENSEFCGTPIIDFYDYQVKILWFQPPKNNVEIAQKRQNMPNDLDVRKTNTCLLSDFKAANLIPDHKIICNPQQVYIDDELRNYLAR
jgi:hypothetical protein